MTRDAHPGEASAQALSRIGDASTGPSSWFRGAELAGIFEWIGIGAGAGAGAAAGAGAGAAAGAVAAGGAAAGSGDVEVWTVTDADARRRDPDDAFAMGPRDERIPRWTQVAILEERTMAGGAPVVRVAGIGGAELGWTAKSNLTRFVKDQPALRRVATVPAADRQLTPINARSSVQRAMCDAWNRFGALLEELERDAGIPSALALAIWYKESGSLTHTPGRMVIRFEAHKFHDLWRSEGTAYSDARFDDHFRYCGRGIAVGDVTPCGTCEATAGGSPKRWTCQQVRHPAPPGGSEADRAWTCVSNGVGQAERYRILDLAIDLGGDTAAKKSISMGGPQIMGFNHESVGYPTVQGMYDAFQDAERWQVLGLIDFLLNQNAALPAAATADPPDVERVGELYNGAAAYGRDLRDKYDTATELLDTLPAAPAPT